MFCFLADRTINYHQAEYWFEKAAAQSNKKAKANLEELKFVLAHNHAENTQ
ncbi:hypothetical protein [Suttonella ornithocola]|uniref:Sel1 repeat n=1 Tax=Suttonella ornithocola TaxID=279832 RepID=A0A380MSG3_9GAMM|nr:hypothetical protein [Suttonella ornithocola]SUO94277.1 Uncharacterised protein [Suttonella ornithocola]